MRRWRTAASCVLRDGKPVGEVTSAAFGAALDRVVMLAILKTGGAALMKRGLSAQQFEVDIGGTRIAVGRASRPLTTRQCHEGLRQAR